MRKLLIILVVLTLISGIILVSTCKMEDVKCTRCEEVWHVISQKIVDEEINEYICPLCRDKSSTTSDNEDEDNIGNEDNDSGSIYTNPIKGHLYRQMGGTGGLW